MNGGGTGGGGGPIWAGGRLLLFGGVTGNWGAPKPAGGSGIVKGWSAGEAWSGAGSLVAGLYGCCTGADGAAGGSDEVCK